MAIVIFSDRYPSLELSTTVKKQDRKEAITVLKKDPRYILRPPKPAELNVLCRAKKKLFLLLFFRQLLFECERHDNTSEKKERKRNQKYKEKSFHLYTCF